jgi:hypothetical protein
VGAVGGVAAVECALAGVPTVGFQLSADYDPQPDDWIWSSQSVAAISEKAIQLLRHPDERLALASRQALYARTHHAVEGMVRSYRDAYNSVDPRTAA